MPGGCDLGGRIGFYRFIENKMKSNGLGSGNAADPDDADVITDSTIAYFGRLCGRRLTIREHMMRTISSGLSMSYKLEVD
jgi:hypothetical protein